MIIIASMLKLDSQIISILKNRSAFLILWTEWEKSVKEGQGDKLSENEAFVLKQHILPLKTKLYFSFSMFF